MDKDKQTGFMISKESVEKVFPKNDVDILGYESPVKVIMGQMRMEQENNIFKAIQDYGVDVDKDELIKALQYDRDQYEKGYINGYNRKAYEVAREIFEEIEEMLNMQAIIVCETRKTVMNADEHPLSYMAMLDGRIYSIRVVEEHIADLKKKYTESEKDNG